MTKRLNIKRVVKPNAGARGFHYAEFEGQGYMVRHGYVLKACEGAAHSNPHIDNCMRCAPFWGVVAVLPELP
jgi:hypothetical protein